MLTGGCCCGAVRYEAGDAPFNATICHCRTCRRTTGAPMVAWFTVRSAAFRFTRGAPQDHRSSEIGVRAFCARCGTQLTFRYREEDEVDVTTASLDDPEAVPPADHSWTARRLSWVVLADGLPCHRRGREDG